MHYLLPIIILLSQVFATATLPQIVQCTNPNEEFTECGRRCGESCADQGRQIRCPEVCFLNGGCSCIQGYARDSNDRCIPVAQCSNKALQYPNTTSDGRSTSCPSGILPVSCSVDPCTIDSCPGRPGAQCKAENCGICKAKWFLNDIEVTAQCFSKNNECAADEEYKECGPQCEPRCGDEVIGVCPSACKAGCFCKNGLVRSPSNQCIRREQCSNSSPDVPGRGACKALVCPSGTECVEDEILTRCVARKTITCSDLRCGFQQTCVQRPAGAQCVSTNDQSGCENIQCAPGYHCEGTQHGITCRASTSVQKTCSNTQCLGSCVETPNGPKCLDSPQTTDVCSGSPCGHPCLRCIPDPKPCFTIPCQQYRCLQIPLCLGPAVNSQKSGTCPSADGEIKSCFDRCRTDADCVGMQKCCSNGCGHSCAYPIMFNG